MYQDFGRRRLATVKELKTMAQTWVDEEEKKCKRFDSYHNRGRDNHNQNNNQD